MVRRLLLLVLTVLIVVGLLVWIRMHDREAVLDMAQQALRRGDDERALELARDYLKSDPVSLRALKIAALAARQNGQLREALPYYESIAELSGPQATDALYQLASLSLELGRLSAAEEAFRKVLARNPDDLNATAKLMLILRLEGRNREITPWFIRLAQLGQFPRDFLYPMSAADHAWIDPREREFLATCRSEVSDDLLPELGLIREARLRDEDIDRALIVLRHIVDKRPDLLEAQTQLDSLLLETGRLEEFRDHHRQLPKMADQHPQTWFNRGVWFHQRGQTRAAARCFRESVLLDPDHRAANYELATLLRSLGRASDAVPFDERFHSLSALETLVVYGDGTDGPRSPAIIREIVDHLISLGRYWEATAWCHEAVRQDPALEWPSANIARVRGLLGKQNSVVAAVDPNPAGHLDVSDLPLPEMISAPSVHSQTHEDHADIATVFAFTDDAAAVGLNLEFQNGADPASGEMRVFEFNGGGVAVLDADADGWSDIYLTQGGSQSPHEQRTNDPDGLFRNIHGERYQNIAAEAGIVEDRYSHGAAVGDYNNDGFPDLYIANIGENRFLRNNGDGTFTDATDATGTGGDQWTLSAVVADFNGDTLPDLYAANYLSGPDVFDRTCTEAGLPAQCRPNLFPAEQDRLYENLGDGRFPDVTMTSGIVAENGKGMGVVAADFHGTGRLSLFVANDTTANFFFLNVENSSAGSPWFTETAASIGLAYGETGIPQSCMGVAIGDVSQDGLLDLFVTNYIGQSNNMFVQVPGLLFEDRVRAANLQSDSLPMMGWGVRFVDADLNGRLDLFVANGHLQLDPPDRVTPRMPPQLFRNEGRARFTPVAARDAGPYFEGRYMGRAVARLDWNRDGRPDLCITHVDRPAALLSNRSSQPFNFLKVRLRGRQCARDAIGTSVTITTGDQSIVQQLTAGDGFQASDERCLIFGLGTSTVVDEMLIRWPAGETQVYQSIPANQDLMFIQSRQMPTRFDEEIDDRSSDK